jgi:photosystem II stability/assembly factor-like uncharacterized protein
VVEKVSYNTVKKGKKATKVATRTATRSTLEARVNDVEVDPKHWYAATTAGLFSSNDQGKSWTGGPVMGKQDFVSVASNDELLVAATGTSILFSNDNGTTWKEARLASYQVNIKGVAVTPEGQILVATREGAFRSPDAGANWEHSVNGLPDKNITSIVFDASSSRLLATSSATGVIFESRDGGRSWRRGPDAGYPLRRISVVRGRFMAATPFDGVVAQPENDPQSAAAEPGSN